MSVGERDELRARLRPRARIMRTLGDELISSEVVAVIELVKNAYDADASRVLVRFTDSLDAGAGGVDVIDDGHGMSIDTVETAWLEPATPYRRHDRRSESLGRQVLGEKGIGRFAVSRLADELELVTRRAGADVETSVLFDWTVFDDDDAYLEDIEVVLEEGQPIEITAGGAVDGLWPDGNAPAGAREHGTLLRMTRLRTPWDEARMRELRNGLSRLISPFLFEDKRDREDAFVIDLAVPSLPHLSGRVEPPETIRSPHYWMRATVQADASYHARIRLRNADGEHTKTGVLNGYKERAPRSGAFEVELRVWDRDSSSIADLAGQGHTTATQVRRDLNDAAGVSVYRDGFRVLPYGQSGNDWLSLDSRRVNNPTMRLSNNQVVGYVLISREANPELRDQTNREGLIDNQALIDLRDELRQIIGRLETERYDARPREEPKRPPRRGGLFANLDFAAVRAHASERYPNDARLAELLGEAQENLDEGVERAQEVVARYRRLATLGELIDKVLHDGSAPLGKIGTETALALRDIKRDEIPCENMVMSLQRRFTRVQQQRDVLAAVFKRIEPFGGRRRGRPTPRDVEQIIADSVGVLDSEIQADGVAVELPTSHTTVTADEAELQQVFVNLLRNSLYWLREVPRDDRRLRIALSRDGDGLHILFSDSGPGVEEAVRDRIFEPYFSTAENGVGLGLSIAGEIVEEYYDGRLWLMDDGPLPGANFRVTLRRRV
jgi:signal transduction histidine kinase